MLNRKLLLVSSGADAPSTIGVAGGQGFGVGVYPGSKAELVAMQLTPISGFDIHLLHTMEITNMFTSAPCAAFQHSVIV